MSADPISGLWAERERIEVLFSCRGPRLLWVASSIDRECAERAGVELSQDIGDPELTKNLRTLHHLIGAAVGICERAANGDHARTVRMDLASRVALPRDRPLTIELLLAHRFEVERLLLDLADEDYLRMRAAALYEEGEGTYVRWRDLFASPPPILVEPRARGDGDPVETTRHMLARLLAAKEAQDLALRARRQLKARVVWLILPVIFLATCLFAVALAIVEDDLGSVLLAGAASLAGAALGGLVQLRDEIVRGAQVREFTPFYIGQLMVGATAGLLVYAADRSGLVEIVGGAAGVATLAFVIGFSEAAFLRLLARLGGGA